MGVYEAIANGTGWVVANELKWRYAATVVNPNVSGSRLVLRARDR